MRNWNLMKIKIEITPSFFAPCSFEIKSNGEQYHLIVIRSSTESPADPGAAWHAETNAKKDIETLASLIRNLDLPEPPPSYIVIADGTEVKVSYDNGLGESWKHRFISPPPESHKFKFVMGALDLGKKLIPEDALIRFFDELRDNFI